MPRVPKALHAAPDWASLKRKWEECNEKIDFSKHSEKGLKLSASRLYGEAMKAKKGRDEEMCYVYGMRFCSVVQFLEKKFGRSAVKDLGKEYVEIIDCVEKLSSELPKRYDSISKEKNPVTNPVPLQSVRPLPAKPQPVPAKSQLVPADLSAGEKGDVLNGVSGYQFVSPKQLFEWLNSQVGASGTKKSVLIVDVRPTKDYESSHIKSERSISCPEEIIAKGKTAGYYGTELQNQYKVLWDERKSVDHLVLIDWSSTNPDLQENSPIEIFKGAIDKYDPGRKYVSRPYILDGGFELWNSTYPNLSTCSRVQAPSKEFTDTLDINDISFPDLNESPKSGVMGNGGEPSLYSSFSMDGQYFSSKPPQVDRSSKANAELRYEKNKQDQLQLEKDIDKSKTMLNHLEHELLGNQTKELLDEKKKWEEKYSDLEKQHQFKEEENERLKREIEELKQRERVAAARQAPKPRMTPTTVTDEPAPVPTQAPEQEETNERPPPQEVEKDAVTNDFSAKPVTPDHDDLVDLKRSRSTPNIAQIPAQEWQRPPAYDRSTKPAQQSYGYGSMHRVHGSARLGLNGLKNLGNTCYMNSIIQCISHTSKLAEYFLYENYYEDVNESRSNPTGGEVARAVGSLIRDLWSLESRVIGCEELKWVVGRHVESFAGSCQQDSHEFLTFLINWLHNDLCRSPRKKLVNQELLSGPKMAWAEYKKASGSFISELFFVQQVSTVICRKCQEKSVTYEEPTSNLTLQLPSANNRCTLQDCLRLYTSGELISGYRCESCEQTNDATKKVDIWRLPQILVIHLKRFYSDGFYHKRQTLVDFPLKGLDMRDFTSNTETTNTKYDLYAVSNHYGTLEGGHYTAFCRNKDKWYKFDDQDVTEICPSYVKSPNAYILFYEQT